MNGKAMKTCFKCGKALPLDDFYRHSRMKDGRLNKCIACTKSDVHTHRLLNISRIRKYDNDRASLPHRVEARVRMAADWRRRNPDGRKAHIAVQNAVRAGRLLKLPCEVCGAEKSEAHHPHYGAPLLVTWLCRAHHMQIHHQAEEQC